MSAAVQSQPIDSVVTHSQQRKQQPTAKSTDMLTDVRAATRAVVVRKLEASGAVDGLGCTAGEATLWLDNLPLNRPNSPDQLTYAPSSDFAHAVVIFHLRLSDHDHLRPHMQFRCRTPARSIHNDVALRSALLASQLRGSGPHLPGGSSRGHSAAAVRGP
jgi:hypothetical protein